MKLYLLTIIVSQALLLSFISGCGSGGGDDTNVNLPDQPPTNQSISYNCGSLNVSAPEASEIVQSAIEADVPIVDGGGLNELQQVTRTAGFVVVTCGGQFNSNDSQDNDVTTLSADGVKRAIREGRIAYVEIQ